MSVRPPTIFSQLDPRQSALDALGHEIQGEKASSLGRAGRLVEESLLRLEENRDAARREELLRDAARAVYAYFIQRELCGLRRHGDVIREYAIPPAVLARLGAS